MKRYLQIRLTNDVKAIPRVTDFAVQEVRSTFPDLDQDWLSAIAIALEEALNNAIVHGNLEISSQERLDGQFLDVVAQRRDQAGYRERLVTLQISMTNEAIEIVVRDKGAGFDPQATLAGKRACDDLRAFGRGLLLMNAFMDEVTYNDRGNEVTMVKRLPRLECVA